jgi:iron complex outermembrane receptor protein
VDVKLWFNYNNLSQNLYRSLTYAQIQNLDATYKTDFNETLTGVRAQDAWYYDYNRGDYTNKDFLGLITITPSEQLHFRLKPYVSKEDTQIYQGVTSGGGTIQKRTRDQDRKGVIAEAGWDSAAFKTIVGYHFEDSDMNIYTQNYNPLGLVYQGYGVTGSTGATYIHSPYLKVGGTWQKLDWQAGIKYFRFEDSASEGYRTPAPTYAWVRDTALDREARTYDVVLPSVGLAYKLSDNLQTYASYGKNFIRPYSYVPLVNLYSQNKAAFTAKGIVLNDLFKGYDIEESDTIDLGMRLKTAWFDFAPTVFYGKHKNLLTTIYDPRVALNYQQNIGKATGYGLDVETNIYLHRDLTLFINPTYTILKYDDDLTYAGATLRARDNQVVDTPEMMVKTGLIWKWNALEVIPSVNFIGSRYADVEHKEEVSSYATANLKLSYTFKKVPVAEALKVSCELNNIFDRRYISGINSSDDTQAGATSYMVGAPFSAVVSASVEF